MTYLIIAVLLTVALLFYFRIADRYNIIDKPNDRSSHYSSTVRGGGVIFPLAVLVWFLGPGAGAYVWFLLGLLLIATISFLDDLFSLPTFQRIIVHLLSVALLLYQTGFLEETPYWTLLAIVLIIGWLNAFNFMDGINGISAFYALVALAPLAYLNLQLNFTDSGIIHITGLALLIFSWFNARRRARTFAGDVGSISLAFIIAFVMLQLLLATERWEYIVFLGVYGVDAVCTIIHRLIRRENIFQAHRSHLYQYLANEMVWPQLQVAGVYALLQLGVSALIISVNPSLAPLVAGGILLVLVILYVVSKRYIMKISR